jgi:hypothetical protein
LSRGYMGQVTDRDVEMVNHLIEDPGLSLEELGTRLGVTKQAIAERKKRLEEEGFVKSFYFWNITPRFESTKRVRIQTDRGVEKIGRIIQLLDRYNPVVVFFRTAPEDFFQGRAQSLTDTIDGVEGILHFNNEEEEGRLRMDLDELGIKESSIEPVLFSRLLGENCDLEPVSPEEVRDIANGIAQRMMSNASVLAVICERTRQPVDQFDLVIIRDERFQPASDSYERRERRALVDLHFTNLRWFMGSEDEWLKDMEILYAQDESLRRRIQRKLDDL